MLEPWCLRQKWLKKRIARWLYQDRDLKCATALHATAESEAEQFRRLGFRNPVIVSPNGVNVPKIAVSRKSLVVSGQREENGRQSVVSSTERKRRVLFVSRMHPKKGVLELVEAWGKLVVSGQSLVVSGWVCELVYTVNGEIEQEYEAKVKTRGKDLGLQEQLIFTGALKEEEKWRAYARADLFVLPTYSENFGIVVAEALWAGVPVITTKGTPWQELNERKCGWWIDIGVDALVKALAEAIALTDEERHEMGMRGRKLVEKKYTWNAVVKEMIEGYNRSYLSSVLSMSSVVKQ
jgi:glycosyltransferase involved in cell wall biosynthesis